jgi:hypothetical protein
VKAVPVTVELPVLTLIGPEVAPAGTVTTNCVCVAETTVAATPLKVTVLELAVVENPVPLMTICVPGAPWSDDVPANANVVKATVCCDVMFPAASYW